MNDSLRCHSQCFIRILPDHFPFVILYGCHTSINKTIINLFYTIIWHSVPFFQIIMAIIINQPTSNRSVKEPLRFCGILLRSLEIAQDSGWWPAFQYLFETWKKKRFFKILWDDGKFNGTRFASWKGRSQCVHSTSKSISWLWWWFSWPQSVHQWLQSVRNRFRGYLILFNILLFYSFLSFAAHHSIVLRI